MWPLLNGRTFFGVVVLAMSLLAWREAWFAYASKRWPTTVARLHFAAPFPDDGGYVPKARYSYTVHGVSYESTRWRFGSSAMVTRELAADAMTRELDALTPVVFYDPGNPSRSCLVPGVTPAILISPILVGALGVALLVLG
jgi:hypothetical protein